MCKLEEKFRAFCANFANCWLWIVLWHKITVPGSGACGSCYQQSGAFLLSGTPFDISKTITDIILAQHHIFYGNDKKAKTKKRWSAREQTRPCQLTADIIGTNYTAEPPQSSLFWVRGVGGRYFRCAGDKGRCSACHVAVFSTLCYFHLPSISVLSTVRLMDGYKNWEPQDPRNPPTHKLHNFPLQPCLHWDFHSCALCPGIHYFKIYWNL